MRKILFVTVLLLNSVVITSPAPAQARNCDSRVIEETIKKVVIDKLGPDSFSYIQTRAATGRALRVTANVLTIKSLGSIPYGQRCFATMSVWREDTQERFNASIKYILLHRNTNISIGLIKKY